MSNDFNHLNERGEAHMVNVGGKEVTERSATARSFVTMSAQTLTKLTEGSNPKGDVLAVARIAGIQAAKKTSDWIPLCHPLLLTHVAVDITIEPEHNRVRIDATVALAGKTGVEMEALTAASATALTLYDMCKAQDKGMIIGPTFLQAKTGGKSGPWQRTDEANL